MFGNINKDYSAKKRAKKENQFIAESVLGIEEVLPGSEEEMADMIDVDSVPDEVYKKIDAELDKIVSDPNYDDSEADELADDDLGEDDEDDEAIDAIVNEAVNGWDDDK